MPHRRRIPQPISQPEWHDPMVDMLIDERQRRNVQYHNTYSRSREDFWESVAQRFLYMIF